MNILKTPQQKLLEETGAVPSSPGYLKTPKQLLLEESGAVPKMYEGGGMVDPQLSPQDMLAALIAAGYQPQKLAAGGQPELGEARAYENTPSEAVRDWFAKRIGYETADRLFGGPRADAADRLLLQSINPINYATGAADAAKEFYEKGKKGEYPEAMLAYGLGILNLLPFLGKGKTALQRVVSPMSVKENLPNLGIAGASELGPLKAHK